MKVKCKDNDEYDLHLTIDKVYEVIGEYQIGDDDFYKLIGDKGTEISAWQSRFEIVEEKTKEKKSNIITGGRSSIMWGDREI